MHIRTRILSSVLVLTASVFSGQSHAQLHGDWPVENRWNTVSDIPPSRADNNNGHASATVLSAPRGDLRKDVADANHGAPRRR